MESESFVLGKLLESIKDNELQIPDFQRDWVWNDDQIKSLIESVIRGFPINSIMLLECDADKTKFSYKPIKGVSTSGTPRYLVLDGQQRLTSLFCALYSKNPVELPDGTKRYYYVDMKKAVESIKNSTNVESMIISVPENKKTKTLDLSTPEKEFAANIAPLNKIIRDGWIMDYIVKNATNPSAVIFAKEFEDRVIKNCIAYKIVYIKLEKTTPIAIVCKIFEKVNTGGTELTVFELLTAILAIYPDNTTGKRINLPEDWKEIRAKFSSDPNSAVLDVVSATDFVTALTLLATYRKGRAASCKREDILNLNGSDYLQYKDSLIEGFTSCAEFLDGECIRAKKYLPYATQLIPMSAIFAQLKLSGVKVDINKIRQWYWCGVFGESYRSAQETRYGRDISEITDWIANGNAPKMINETQMSALRLLFLKTRTSAAYKGIISIIFRNGAKDFLANNSMSSSAAYAESIDIHHIFPKEYCIQQGYPENKYDSIANKTPILGSTNKMIRDKPPSKYLTNIQNKTGCSSNDVDDFLKSHFADANLCHADKFDDFVVDRAKNILDKIESLTGRSVSDRNSQDIIEIFGATL
ncbi:MAG: DUF262 domain-containing protein [Selenomonadaceae bacterium]|nr:DUF262 domain-containing protein [Selenomonadaceae bacterium]